MTTQRPVNDGKEFERIVAGLLRLKGAQSLTREKQLPSKKIDLYFEEVVYGKRRRFAVECKDLAGVLTKADVEKIHISYLACFRSAEITDLLIVSRAQLAPSAQSYVDALPEITFQTQDELRNSIIDFNGYVAGLKARFLQDEVWHYHVPPQGTFHDAEGQEIASTPTRDSPDLCTAILERFQRQEGPMIVLGAYGIGKTTLARQLFLEIADAWERDPSAPIPIYISLERMQQEQSLEGLLGSVFTTGSVATGYTFDSFVSLNDQGHFTVILDGIDEMRHKLNKEEFLYNIDQLMLLAERNPRTILLGRPSAFMDEEEYDHVVHGRKRGDVTPRVGSRLASSEIHLSMLSRVQIETFVDKYCRWKQPKNPRYPERVLSVIKSDTSGVINDIVRRPIQMMMFLEIFPELPRPLDQVTKATVYSIFIDSLITREKKRSRSRRFSNSDHRDFGRMIAWWLWRQGGAGRIQAKQVDAELFRPFARGDDDVEDVRRTLIAASFLTTEGGTKLHFPHRSLQEFLVAEELSRSLVEGVSLDQEYQGLHAQIRDVFSVEVVDFLSTMMNMNQIWRLIRFFDSGPVIPSSAMILLRDEVRLVALAEDLRRSRSVSAAYLVTATIANHERLNSREHGPFLSIGTTLCSLIDRTVEDYLTNPQRDADEAFGEVASYLQCILVLASAHGHRILPHNFMPMIVRMLQRFGRRETLLSHGTRRRRPTKEQTITLLPQAVEFLDLLDRSLSTERLNLGKIYGYLRRSAHAAPTFQLWGSGALPTVTDFELATEMFRGQPAEIRKLEELFFEKRRARR